MGKKQRNEVIRRLQEAANLIRGLGWCQRAFKTRDSRVCAVGALRIASFGTTQTASRFPIPPTTKSRQNDRIHRHCYSALLNAVGGNPALWNDKRGRTKRQVLGAFKRAEKYV